MYSSPHIEQLRWVCFLHTYHGILHIKTRNVQNKYYAQKDFQSVLKKYRYEFLAVAEISKLKN